MTGDVADIVVVGGGHNGLVCAAYLARAGLDVIVVEQGERPGGALISTDWEGHRLERGAVEHTSILTSGVLDELDLAAHGLTYRCRTVAAVHVFGDGTEVVIDETAEQTAESIAPISAADARAWRDLAALSAPLLQAFGLASGPWIAPPPVAAGFARLAAGRAAGPLLELIRMPVAELARRWFESPQMRALAMFRSVFSGLAPWSAGSSSAFLLTTAGHGRRFGRPVGGSRALVEAMVAAVKAAGGAVRCRFPVRVVQPAGSSWVVRSATGEAVTARRAVVSAMAPRPFLLDVLQPQDILPARVRRRLDAVVEVADNMSQLTLSAAIDDDACLPTWDRPDLRAGALWLLPEPSAAMQAHVAAQLGQVPEAPATLVTFPSVTDPGAAPPGRATMWANSFTPRHLHGRTWSEATDEAADGVWRSIDACLPGIRGHAVHEVLTTPDDLTAMTGAENAGGHVAGVPRQTLGWRPAPGLGNYRTPIEGIFLTGAGTHPGGSVSGAPGRACAGAVLQSLRGGRSRTAVARQAIDAFWAARGVANAPTRSLTVIEGGR